QHGPAARCRGEETAADRGRGEQRDHEAGRETDTAAEHPTDARRGLVLLLDLDLAVLTPMDQRGVVRVDESGLYVQVLDRLVVDLRILQSVVRPCVDEKCVDGHRSYLRSGNGHIRGECCPGSITPIG